MSEEYVADDLSDEQIVRYAVGWGELLSSRLTVVYTTDLGTVVIHYDTRVSMGPLLDRDASDLHGRVSARLIYY